MNIISFLCSSIATSESPGDEQTFRGQSQGHSEVHIKVKFCLVLFWRSQSSLFFVPRPTKTEACLHIGRSGPSETSKVHLQGFDLESAHISILCARVVFNCSKYGYRSAQCLSSRMRFSPFRCFVRPKQPRTEPRIPKSVFSWMFAGLIKSHSIFCPEIILLLSEYTHWC